MEYKFIKDLTSDVLFEAYGKDLQEVLVNSAKAMFTVICDIEHVKQVNAIDVDVKGRDEPELLFNWLQELIAQVDIESMFFSQFQITNISHNHVKAKIFGEPISQEKGQTVVKAVTNYKFSLEKNKNGYIARVSLDI